MAKKNLTLEEKLDEAIVKDGPYEVPGNWVWTKLRFISDLVTGNTPSKNNLDYYGQEVPFIKPNDLGQGRRLISSNEMLSKLGADKARILPRGSTAVCCIGSIGKSAYLEVEGATNQQINSIIPININNLYIYYYVLSEYFQKELKNNSSATTISIINKSKMGELKVPIPPLKEQMKIVDRVESLFEKLDNAKELIEEAREGFQKRKVAIFEKAFRGELTGKWRKDTNIYSVEDVKFEELFSFIGGGTPPKAKNEYWNGEISWASVKDIKNEYLYDTIDRITEEGVKNSSTNIAKFGEIILVTRISPGKVTIAQKYIAINQDLKIVRSKMNRIDNKYMYYLFLYKEKELISKSQGTTVKGITINELNKIEINLPTLKEQKEIVRILDKLLENETKIEELTQLEEQIELIKKSILAKAFRGELGTNCEEDESALEVLKKILREQ